NSETSQRRYCASWWWWRSHNHTSLPRERSSRTSCLPTVPSPPVTRILIPPPRCPGRSALSLAQGARIADALRVTRLGNPASAATEDESLPVPSELQVGLHIPL